MQNNFVEQKLSSDDVFLDEELFTVFDVNSLYKSEISVPLKIENQECSLQLDTGCALSLAPQTFYEQFCSHIPLKPTAVRLSTYTGEKIQPLGQINVNVTYAGTQQSLQTGSTTGLWCLIWKKLAKVYKARLEQFAWN